MRPVALKSNLGLKIFLRLLAIQVSRSCRLPHGTVKYICAYSRSPPEHLDTIPAIASAGSPAASQQDNEATDTLAEAGESNACILEYDSYI